MSPSARLFGAAQHFLAGRTSPPARFQQCRKWVGSRCAKWSKPYPVPQRFRKILKKLQAAERLLSAGRTRALVRLYLGLVHARYGAFARAIPILQALTDKTSWASPNTAKWKR